MPFNQALFWFGLTAFATGLYYLWDSAVKRLHSISLTVLGTLACVYTVYRDSHPELPAIHLWMIMLVLTWVFLGYAIYLHRFRRLPPPPTEKPKEPSKLRINWANYRAVENVGDICQVGDFLQQIISGDSLVFDIENHNFVIGDKNFVPHDPAPFKEKRLQVNYSYAGNPPVTTERREHGRLLLPEDSKIKWLMDEAERLKAGQLSVSEALNLANPQLTDGDPRIRLDTIAVPSDIPGFMSDRFVLHNEGGSTAYRVKIEDLDLTNPTFGKVWASFQAEETILANAPAIIVPVIHDANISLPGQGLAPFLKWATEPSMAGKNILITYYDYNENEFKTSAELVYAPMPAATSAERARDLAEVARQYLGKNPSEVVVQRTERRSENVSDIEVRKLRYWKVGRK